MNKKIIMFIVIIISVFLVFLVINKSKINKEKINTEPIEVVPLSASEKEIVEKTISSSEIVKDIPEEESIALRFYKFENGERVWQDEILLGNKGFLSGGEPAIYLTLHSKYIQELENKDLCTIIQEANEKGDLGFDSEYGNIKLLLKYSSMLKHKDCLGF